MARVYIVLFIIFCCHSVAFAKVPYTISANSVDYDSKADQIIAQGKVEIFRDKYILKADKVIYYKANNKAFAHGNVYLLTPSGDEFYADTLELDSKLKEVIAQQVSARIGDNTGGDNRFIAKEAHDYKDRIEFGDVAYSPCPVCKERSPQWQINSKKIDYVKKENVSYWSNLFEVYGIPIFYFPYLRTAAPDAEPRSGFLIPGSHRYRSIYGYGVSIPYYLRIADNKDLFYTPIITTRESILHKVQYRHLIKNGYYEIDASYINPKGKVRSQPQNRYYVNGRANYDIDDKFKLISRFEKVSDKSYLPNYWDISKNYLSSEVALDYQNYRDYGYVKSYYFQGLRSENENDKMPFILPIVELHKEFINKENTYLVDFNSLNLMRKQGTDVRRVSMTLGWNKTYFWGNSELGVMRRVRGDIYDFTNKNEAEVSLGNDNIQAANNNKKNVYRAIPELEFMLKYPLIKSGEGYNAFLQPTTNLILSPDSAGNQDVGDNEDSQRVEIDDSNLFSADRYSGFDLVEHGARINYGVLSSVIINSGVEYNFLFGQSYRVRKSNDYPVESGFRNKHFSDYVGRVSAKPFKFLDLYYKTRIDSKNYTLRRGELGTSLNFRIDNNWLQSATLRTGFVNYNLISTENNLDSIRKVLNLEGILSINKEWDVSGGITKNFSKNKSFEVEHRTSLGYNSGCTRLIFSILKRNTKDPARDIIPGVSYLIEYHLKNIN